MNGSKKGTKFFYKLKEDSDGKYVEQLDSFRLLKLQIQKKRATIDF